MDEVLAIPGGLGLGSLLTVIIQSIIQNSNVRSKRAFEEKKKHTLAFWRLCKEQRLRGPIKLQKHLHIGKCVVILPDRKKFKLQLKN
ncbi:hypothetical protein [Planktotalea arctica]|uniref:hypothetical protein n=1 Tax=Planktotalea arctica TaxID=1481893 RepID=UPI00321AD987